MHKRKILYKVVLFFFIIAQFQFISLLDLPEVTIPGTQIRLSARQFSFVNPEGLDSAGLSSASATLSNPRLSFQGRVASGYAAGTNVITLSTTANTYGDINTGNLFPLDNIDIGPMGSLQVASISSQTVFTLKTGLPIGASATDNIYATQSGTMTVNFYTSAAIPNGGTITISIPASNGTISGSRNDGLPDTASGVAYNGFDLNGMGTGNITCPNGNFSATSVNLGTGGPGNPHTIICTYNGSSLLPGANLTIVIGTGTKPLVNPAPVNTAHTQGTADVYPISIATKDSGGNLIENVDTRVAPVEGVLVTATVDETLSFSVNGVAVGSTTYCGTGHTTGLTTTATAVPWGVINTVYNADRNNAVQRLAVSTNSPTGYTVYVQANDQMGKDGNVCTGSTPNPYEYIFGGNTCIRDANCGGGAYSTCTHTTTGDWAQTPNGYGFGYSLQNETGKGTDAVFTWGAAAQFLSRQFPDTEAASASASIMTNAGPTNDSQIDVCYRINLPGGQPAGWYFNKIKYTAVARF